MLGEPELANVKKDQVIQLQRRGFFRVDVAPAPPSPHTCKATPLVLFHVPDGHTKEMPGQVSGTKVSQSDALSNPATTSRVLQSRRSPPPLPRTRAKPPPSCYSTCLILSLTGQVLLVKSNLHGFLFHIEIEIHRHSIYARAAHRCRLYKIRITYTTPYVQYNFIKICRAVVMWSN